MSISNAWIANWRRYWQKKGVYDKLIILASMVFLGAVAFYLIIHQVFFTPDQFYGLAFIFALVIGQAKSFVWDWTPMLLLILSYEYLRGLIPSINHHVHYQLMFRFDMLLLGRIPAVSLQQSFYTPGQTHWYDYVGVVLYLMHFIVPLLTAFVFWLTDKKYFREFVIGIVILTYLTFLTYLVFPAAPPWLASQNGLIPHVHHITITILGHFFHYLAVPNVYGWFGANLTAAVPSLHAAYPLFSAIYIFKKAPKSWPLLMLYVFGVWLAVMYLGEHYFFDVTLGAIYALGVYALLQRAKTSKFVRRKLIGHPAEIFRKT